MPDLALELAHGADRGRIVIGIDEAGRGPWAGPVVAAAVWLNPVGPRPAFFGEFDDSKTLPPKVRDRLYTQIMHESRTQRPPPLVVATGQASVAEIDRINVLQGTFLAMRRAVEALTFPKGARPDVALVDGNRTPELPCPAVHIVKGDSQSLSIAGASIVAKVTRDRLMDGLAATHPGYGWERNRGYGTAEHRAALKTLGVTPEHRRSFRPIREIINITR